MPTWLAYVVIYAPSALSIGCLTALFIRIRKTKTFGNIEFNLFLMAGSGALINFVVILPYALENNY